MDYSKELIPNFSYQEAACKCGCGLIIVQRDLMQSLGFVRLMFAKPIIVTSWARCKYWNKMKKGKEDSFHLYGKAIDLKPQHGGITKDFIEICVEYFTWTKVYDGHIHCDIRGFRGLGQFLILEED